VTPKLNIESCNSNFVIAPSGGMSNTNVASTELPGLMSSKNARLFTSR